MSGWERLLSWRCIYSAWSRYSLLRLSRPFRLLLFQKTKILLICVGFSLLLQTLHIQEFVPIFLCFGRLCFQIYHNILLCLIFQLPNSSESEFMFSFRMNNFNDHEIWTNWTIYLHMHILSQRCDSKHNVKPFMLRFGRFFGSSRSRHVCAKVLFETRGTARHAVIRNINLLYLTVVSLFFHKNRYLFFQKAHDRPAYAGRPCLPSKSCFQNDSLCFIESSCTSTRKIMHVGRMC